MLAKGFGATSIEEVIAEAGLTKSGFFYHFKDKNALARECSAAMSRPRSAVRRHFRARPSTVRRSAAGVPYFTEAAGRNHGRPAERPSGLPDREHLLSGAAVRSRSARTLPHNRCGTGMRASARSSTASPRCIRRGSRSISMISPICCLHRRRRHHHVEVAERSDSSRTADSDFSKLRQADVCRAVALLTRKPRWREAIGLRRRGRVRPP